ncbi:unnamed protein product [Nezara viridula]|uniref:Mitochondrial ATPase inhibitor n=1 Tax=Nezara viridula TaxID=85310 RepID=A0A9P0HLB3_NEZVI|nr:unnamed protein product [Nezara viridula]
MHRFLIHALRTRSNPRTVASKLSNDLSTGLGDPGSGAGKGGGGGGSIRNTGGAFGKREAALEGEYFHKMQKKQLQKLKEMLDRAEGDLEKAQEAVNKTKERPSRLIFDRTNNFAKSSDDPGSRDGRGSSDGNGDYFNAIDALKKREADIEDEYFAKMQKKQLEKLTERLTGIKKRIEYKERPQISPKMPKYVDESEESDETDPKKGRGGKDD